MKRLLFAAILAAAVVCATSARDYQGGIGTLAGTVLGPTGAPVAGARVTSQQADGAHPHSTTTNDQGRFFFPELHHGLYDVRAYSGGVWSEWKHNITVSTGKQTDVTLRLPARKKKKPATTSK